MVGKFDDLERLASRKDAWVELALTEKRKLVEDMLQEFNEFGYDGMVQHAGKPILKLLGIPEDTHEGFFEQEMGILLSIYFLKPYLKGLIEVINFQLNPETKPKLEAWKSSGNGQVCVNAFPTLAVDKEALMADCKGEVWLDPEVTDSVDQVEVGRYDLMADNGVMIVLGAGNNPGLAMSDALHALFLRTSVVYLKLHPARNYLAPFFEKVFGPLIHEGYFFVEGHASNDRVKELIHHPKVTHVHITGGKATHDMLVWGDSQKERKSNIAKRTPKLKAKMTSELGAVSPWIAVPGNYKRNELEAQAKLLAYYAVNNASCNCNSPKVLVLSDEWKQKDAFLAIVKSELDTYPPPVPYYPGIMERWNVFRQKYPNAEELGACDAQAIKDRKLTTPQFQKAPEILPCLLIPMTYDLSDGKSKQEASQEYLLQTEPFCPVLAVVSLQKTSTLGDFYKTAATFCNEYLLGTLSCTVSVAPAEDKTDDFEGMIASLRYGGIGINEWGGTNYALLSCGWGGFPGESLDDVQSGIGLLNNVLGIKGFQKCVFRSAVVRKTQQCFKKDLKKEAMFFQAFNKFVINPGFGTTFNFISRVLGMDPMIAKATSMTVLIAAVGLFWAS